MRIPVAAPVIGRREREYVQAALEAGEVSSLGRFVREFEEAFARYLGAAHAVATANGTVALHLALLALSVGPGDEVLVPALTFVATANAVVYCGARPVLVDVDPVHGNLDPQAIEAHVSPATRGIIVVHLYGHPVDYDAIAAVATRRGLWVLEDAAEAHGAEYRGRKAGTLAPVGVFSFYGNKIVTTGEGGMVVTNDPRLAARMRLLRDHGMSPGRRYWHEVIGFNYRMTNLQAALGLAQLSQLDEFVARKRAIASRYANLLTDVPGLRVLGEESWAKSAFWMTCLELDEAAGWDRQRLMAHLAEAGIETRPFFVPLSRLPMYEAPEGRYPVAERLGRQGMNLPSGVALTDAQVDYVARLIRSHAERSTRRR